MKTATISELKHHLQTITNSEMTELCVRLARYKKENKELLTYLLFEAHNENGYIESIKIEINEEFETLPKSNLHLTKKSIRKVLRSITKYARYTGGAQSHIEMLLHFCFKLNQSTIPINKSPAIEKLYANQINKIYKLLDSLHEDLRYDYSKQLKTLEPVEPKGKGFLSWLKKSQHR
jgi:hypothetical protein